MERMLFSQMPFNNPEYLPSVQTHCFDFGSRPYPQHQCGCAHVA